jgi:hypothetical protein
MPSPAAIRVDFFLIRFTDPPSLGFTFAFSIGESKSVGTQNSSTL